MEQIKQASLKTVIPKSLFEIFKIDGLTLKQISKLYTIVDLGMKSGCHRLAKFVHHIKTKHNMSLSVYCETQLGLFWPVCPLRATKVGYKFCSEGIRLSRFARGGVSKEHCPAFNAACEKFSKERAGSGNPMFGLVAWNKGLGLEDERVARVAAKRRGRKTSEETKKIQSLRRKEHPLKARHITKHSAETIKKLRENTARLWSSGRFNRISSIHVKVREYLKTLPLKYPAVEEYQVKYFSMDFAFPQSKIAVECQGTYFHIDPRIYPGGPKDAIQRRNFGRDKAKRKVCGEQEGWKIIELWETEINDGSFKEYLKNKLTEYQIINVQSI